MNVNVVLVTGRVGKVDLKKTTNSHLLKLSVAVNKNRKNKAGEWESETEWVNVTAWGDLAERASKNLAVGDFAHVQGELKTDSWEKDGEKKYSTGVLANQIKWIPKKKNADFMDVTKEVKSNSTFTTDEIPF